MTTPNNSATGGYLKPSAQPPLPGNLSFQQFIQQVFVGISGLDGTLIRPRWQVNPPKEPDLDVNWVAISLTENDSDINAYTDIDVHGNNVFQRMEQFEVPCSFYGPNSYDIARLTRDGFQIPQNLEALLSAGMAFVQTTRIRHVPDLVNERWIDRYEMSVILRREVLRVYPILTFLSASGTILANTAQGLKTVEWSVNE